MAAKKAKKVTIRVEDTDGYEPTSIEVLVDGKPIGDGSIGGEPEDNNIVRSYSWIVPLVHDLAKKLGAEVVEEKAARREF